MKTRTSMAMMVGCAVVMLFMTAPVAADDPCSKCGWEPYWVDTCAPDFDEIPEVDLEYRFVSGACRIKGLDFFPLEDE